MNVLFVTATRTLPLRIDRISVRPSYGDMAFEIGAENSFRVRKLANGDSVIYADDSDLWCTLDGYAVSIPFIVFRMGEYTAPESPTLTEGELRSAIVVNRQN